MKKLASAAALLALAVCCACSGSAGTTVSGTGATDVPARPGGLPTETPVGAERAHPTSTPLPSNIPPTPRR